MKKIYSSSNFVNFANFAKFAKFATGYFARIAALLLMLITMSVGQVWAGSVTSDGSAIMYYKVNAVSWWSCGTNYDCNHVYFYGTSGNAWAQGSTKVSGTDVIVSVTVPIGTWDHCILVRGKSTTAEWQVWNKTGDISLADGKNYLSSFAENQTTATWGTYVPAPSAFSLSAATTTNILAGGTVTFTPSITSAYDDIKSVAYSVSPSAGTSVSGNVITFTNAGTYSVTATITYNAKGFTSITGTTSATNPVSVNVASPTNPTHSVSYTAQAAGWTYGGTRPTTVEEGQNVSFTVTPATGYTVTVTATGASLNKDGNTYSFTMGTSDVAVTVAATETAYTVNVAAGVGGTVSPTSATAKVVTKSVEITATPSAGYNFVNWTLPVGVTAADGYTANSNPIKINATAASKTITANFAQEVCVYVLKSLASGFEVPGVTFVAQGSYRLWAWDEQGDKFTNDMSAWDSRPTFSATMTDPMGNTWYKIAKTNAACGTYAMILTAGSTNIFSTESDKNTVDGEPATKWQFTGNAWIVPTSSGEYTACGYASENPVKAIVTYAVTISNGDHGTVSPTGDQEVGSAGLDLTVTPESGYIFDGWNTTGGASMDGNHLTATADGTVTATYREAGSTKIYFYNDKDWATVKVHKWGGSLPRTDWPGVAADLESITHDGHTIYSVTITEGEYANIIFNNGNNGNGNQINTVPVSEWTAAKPCLRHTSDQGSEWIALPTQNYKIVYGSKLSVTNSYASGSYVDEGTELTFTAATPDAGYTFAGFFSDGGKTQEITGAGVDMENRTYTVTLNSNIEVHAKYTENLYTVTVSAGEHGSVSPSGEQQVGADGMAITATPDAHYYFNNWTVDDGAGVASTTAATTKVTATADGTVTANFLPKWDLRGSFNSWAATDPFVLFDGNNTRVQLNLTAGNHTFKIHHKNTNDVEGEWYGNSTTITRDNAETGATLNTSGGNVTLTADKDGIYVFHFNVDTKKLTIDFPVPDPTLSIAATAVAGTIYTGQTITLTPTTNQKGELTLCWNCVSKPGEATEPVYTPVAGSTNFTTSVDKAGEYVFSATIGSGECGGSYELLATAPNCTIQVVDAPYSLYINRDGEKDHSLATGSATVHLAAGKEYTFKIHNGGTWYTNCSSSSDVNVMNATNNLRWPFNNTNGSYADTRVATTIEGDYTFTLTIGESGNRYVSVTYPEIAGGKEMYSKAVKDANTDVMIQAFYWAHEGNTSTDYEPFGSVKWADLDGKELGENFDLVWLAPSTVTADYTGYLPMNYSIQGELSPEEETATGRSYAGHGYHSPWGTEAQLKALIANIHTAGGKAIADIVINHSNSDGGNWCTWNTMKFGNSTNNTLYGSYTPDGTWITYNDEMYVSKEYNQYGQKENAGECGNMPEGLYPDDWYATYGSTPNGKTWDYSEYNCTYSRDWAHQKREVREMSRAYLLWLKNEIGYDGWRYDFAKGFHGKYINDYNHASGAYFSVAEVFDGDYKVEEGVLADAGNNTYMFDFPGKYNLMNNAIRNGWYQGLQGTAERTLLFGHKKHAVTFVDNHDTFREGYNLSGQANQMPNSGNQVLQANAYILSMPGVPCVFYPYWHEFKNEIKAMIWARRWTGINSESTVEEPGDGVGDGKYCAKITGTNGSIWLKLGPNAGVGVCPDGYQCAYTGTNVGVYYKVTDASLVKPMISCDKESQEFVGSIPVTFTAKGANVAYTIYYTINGGAEQTVASGTPITIGEHANLNDAITVTAYAKSVGGVPSNTLTYIYTKKADKITLEAAPAAATVGSIVVLTPAAQSGQNHNYHFFVKEPGASNFMSCGFTENGAALNYVMAGEGYYLFYVTTTNTTPEYTSNTVRVNAEPLVYHLRYKKNNQADDQPANWANVTLSPNGDGTYVYYDADAYAYISKGANVGLVGDNTDPYFSSSNIANPDNVNDGDNVVWVYNAFEQTLKVNNPTYHVYRIKVTLTDGRDFYSNIIYETGSAVAVSFYAQTDAELTLERYGKNQENKFTWEEIGSIAMPSILSNGVYTTTAHVTVTAAHNDVPEVTSCTLAEPLTAYDEPYYITTPGQPAPGSTPTKPNYEMTKFDGSHTYYNHYYVAWMQGGQNTYGTVGNTINRNLAGAVGYYVLAGDQYQGANVRYAYNPETNVFTRTHLAGSTSVGYLTAFGTNVQDTTVAHNALTSAVNGQTLADVSNWMYATAVCIGQTETGVASALKLAAQYNGAYTYLLAADGLDSETAKRDLTEAGNNLGEYPQFGVIYDYKENRILSGWNPEGAVINDRKEVSNVIIRRVNDGATSQFTINSGEVLVTDKMITELVITKSIWEGWTGSTEGDYKTLLFWISLPYDCTINSVYGFAYPYRAKSGSTWEMQNYRGDMRGAGTLIGEPWKALAPISTLKANTGYVLAVKLAAADFKTIGDKSEIRFFFPSKTAVTLTHDPQSTLAANSGSTAEIQQGWNVMGVPVMKSNCGFTQSASDENKFEYAYRWTWADGGRWYEPFALLDVTDPDDKKHFNFESGHAYMVQVKEANTLTWNYTELAGSAWAPARARVASNMLTDRNFRVDLYYSDEMQDKTYVKYRTNGTRDYERGRDLEKIENAGRSMIYSELQDKLAAICLADTDHVQIPLTVVASESGEYVLRLPAAVDGVEPVLYDAQEGVTTMLNYDEYAINLPAGTYKNRFFLGIEAKSPTVTTSVETVGAEGDKVMKFIDHNGQLMVLRAGHLYDAQGHMVK